MAWVFLWHNSMAQGPETNFIQRVHRHLPKNIYRWKIAAAFNNGVPDCYYSGPQNDLWIEYKAANGRLSDLQSNWLTKRWDEGRNVYMAQQNADDTVSIFEGNLRIATRLTFKDFIQFITHHASTTGVRGVANRQECEDGR